MEITGSVGMGCVNNRNDVLVVQDALKKKAFPELAVDGIIGPQTISAIRTFQRKFLRQPDGIISVGGTTAQHLFSGTADSANLLPVDMSGGLIVSQGQVTFDAEGNDNPASIYFSRLLHWPGGLSGVTIGRGYDMKTRSEGIVYADLIQAGVDRQMASLMSKGSTLSGNNARKFVHENKTICGAITRNMQVNLFNNIYPQYVSSAQSYYNKYKDDTCVSWNDMKDILKEIIIDMRFQGALRDDDIAFFGQNDIDVVIQLIELTPRIRKYENGRHRADYLRKGM